MADNPTVNGVVVATDDIGGVQYQRLKVTWGSDGTATDVSTSNPLPTRERRSSTGSVTAATVTTSAASAIKATNSTRISISVFNNSSVYIYIGFSSSMTVSDGIPLAPGALFEERDYTGAVYAITSSGTADARIIEIS